MRIKYLIAITILIPAFVFAQDSGKKKAYFFYLDSCPHCHNVNDYFNANGIYDKYDIRKLDASVLQNGEFLLKLYEANGYSEDQRGGVPVAAFGDKFFVGDKPIIDNFVKEIDASDIAFQLPNPGREGSDPGVVVHEGPIAAVPSASTAAEPKEKNVNKGNKNNLVPVVITAITVICAGALIYVSRKKS